MPLRLSSVALLVEVFLTQNCEDDDVATLLDNLHSCIKTSVVSSPSQSTSHDRETTDDVPRIVYVNEA